MCIQNILIRGPRINEPISSVVFWCIFIIPLAYQPPLYPIQLRTQLVHCTERYPAANENIYTTSINYIISIIIPFQVRRHCFDYKYGIQSVKRERERQLRRRVNTPHCPGQLNPSPCNEPSTTAKVSAAERETYFPRDFDTNAKVIQATIYSDYLKRGGRNTSQRLEPGV